MRRAPLSDLQPPPHTVLCWQLSGEATDEHLAATAPWQAAQREGFAMAMLATVSEKK